MKNKIRSLFFFGAITLFTALLVIFSETAQTAARLGMDICVTIIIPSLFPFFVLSSLLISTGTAQRLSMVCGKIMPPIFGVSGSGALPLILGFVGGYPIGIKTISELYTSGGISRKEAERLMIFAGNTGPAFIMGAAGAAVFRSTTAGIILYISHIVSALIIGICCRIFFGDVSSSLQFSAKGKVCNLSGAFSKAVTDSFVSILNVCAFVILFSVFYGFFTKLGLTAALSSLFSFFGADPVKFKSVIAGFFELSAGIASLKDFSADLSFAMPAAAFILSWGGLSVHCQALSFTSGTGLRLLPYIVGKLLHGLLAAIVTWFIITFLGVQPVFSFVGHETVKSFIFDYMGLFYSAACAAAGFIILIITSIRSKNE